jgi:DNA-binding LacI/PurR family transcriptional regulator
MAAEFGVALASMQRALRRAGRARLLQVRERHAVRVLPGAAARAGRRLARLAAQSQRRRVAVLLPERYFPLSGNPFYNELTQAIIIESRHRGILTSVIPWSLYGQVSASGALARRGFGAAFAIGFRPEHMVSLYVLREHHFPVATFNRRYDEIDTPSVRIDDYAAARSLVDGLVELGHRNICLVIHETSPTGEPADVRHGRTAGWIDAVRAHGLTRHCLMPIYVGSLSPLDFYNPLFVRLMRSSVRPTALVFGHVPWALQFLANPRFRHLEVPREVSLVTFEGSPELAQFRWCPPLTTLRTETKRIAQCAVETLEKLLAGDPKPPTIRVPMKVEYTDSLGAAPAKRRRR